MHETTYKVEFMEPYQQTQIIKLIDDQVLNDSSYILG